MSGKGKWDLTSPRSLEAAAEWLRKRAGATCVLVVRGEGYAWAVASDAKPEDAYDACKFVLPDALDALRAQRQAEKEAATRARARTIAGIG